MKLYGEVKISADRSRIEYCEKNAIRFFRGKYGNQLKNLQNGGLNSFGLNSESITKMLDTRKMNRHLHKDMSGENSTTHKLEELTVLKIYFLIKEFYTNKEIIDMLGLPIGVTGMNQIRKGIAWRKVFIREKMHVIPSLNVVKGALTSREKLEVLSKLDSGIDIYEIKSLYNLNITDIKRIQAGSLWKMAWNVYSNFYKPLQLNK